MKRPARMARQPLPRGRMLVGLIVEDCVDSLSGRNLALDGLQEADEFLMAMALHVVADDRSVEDVHGREQGGRPVPLVIMGHGSGAAPIIGRPGWVRSSAWIWLFSSTESTTACAGGST